VKVTKKLQGIKNVPNQFLKSAP